MSYNCSKIVYLDQTTFATNENNKITGGSLDGQKGARICGMPVGAEIHVKLEGGHQFEDNFLYHETHYMALHPIDGVYCGQCKAYSYDQVDHLSSPCVGERDWGEPI